MNRFTAHLHRREQGREAKLGEGPFFQQPEWTGFDSRHNGADDGIYTGDAVLRVSFGERTVHIRPRYDTESGVFGTDLAGNRVELHLDRTGEVEGLKFLGSREVHAVSSMAVITEEDFERERLLTDALTDGETVSNVA